MLQLFDYKNIMFVHEKKQKKQYKINHGKTCYVTKTFHHSKI